MNHPRFTKNQRVHSPSMGFLRVTHPFPDDFNMIGVRSVVAERCYWMIDQGNVEPLAEVVIVKTSWARLQVGDFVVAKTMGGLPYLRVAGHNEHEGLVVVGVSFQDETP